MPIHHEIDRERGLIRTTCTGPVSLDEVLQHFRSLEDERHLPDPLDVLLDLSEVSSAPDGRPDPARRGGDPAAARQDQLGKLRDRRPQRSRLRREPHPRGARRGSPSSRPRSSASSPPPKPGSPPNALAVPARLEVDCAPPQTPEASLARTRRPLSRLAPASRRGRWLPAALAGAFRPARSRLSPRRLSPRSIARSRTRTR